MHAYRIFSQEGLWVGGKTDRWPRPPSNIWFISDTYAEYKNLIGPLAGNNSRYCYSKVAIRLCITITIAILRPRPLFTITLSKYCKLMASFY